MNPTPEQYDYAYTPEGRMSDACFAQTPQNGYTPSAGSLWVDASHPAATRAHSEYAYDPAGRVTSLADYWETYANGTYSQEAILANTCDYETSGLNRGLKTDSKLWTRQTQGQPNWSLLQTDSYGYDGDFDYLTSASYGDGLPNSYQEWSYDAAGNRNDSVCDHLNRAVSIGGYACVNDILGNRLSKGSESYSWDALNRMTSYTGTGPMVSYLYRADGMRVRKASSSGSTVYRYDGQMGMQDVSVVGGDTTVTDYGLGARGVDSILTCVNGGQASTAYPMYDAHGNMISTLTKVDGGGYSYAPLRTCDAWGLVRSGATTGDPKGRYCANLGHKQDDESGLIYMRARYYEPSSGRFASEDPGRHGANWVAYCRSCPAIGLDFDGKEMLTEVQYLVWLSQIGEACLGFEGKKICKAFAIMWANLIAADTWRLGSGVIIGLAEDVQKAHFLVDASLTILSTPSVDPSPKGKAQEEAEALAVCYEVTTWMVLGDVLGF